ncbi:MAG: hypothetical protein V7700_16545 [Halioglobus sp.]
MNSSNERILIYVALIILCAAASVFVGLTAGIYSFLQIAVVIEFFYWIRTRGGNKPSRNWL